MRHIECDSFWLLSHFEWHSHLILLSGWWCFVATTTVAMVVDVLGPCFYSFCIWIVVLVFCIWVCFPFGGLLMRWLNLNGFEHFFCAQNQCFFCLYNIWNVSLYHELLFFLVCLYFCNMFPLILIYLKLFLCFYSSTKCWHHVYVPIQLAIQSEHLRFKILKRISSLQINEKS